MKKRLLIALLAGGAVFATVFGVAASLNVTSDTLGAGGAQVGSCDGDGVHVSYTTKYVANTGFVVDKVTVTGIDNACAGKSLTVQLTGASGAPLGNSETVSVPSAPVTSVTVDFPASNEQPAASVMDVHVVITG